MSTMRRRLWIIGIGAFLSGGMVTAVTVYFLSQPIVAFFASSPYLGAASSGKLYVSVLRRLHGGDVNGAVEALEHMLDMQLITLSDYESAIAQEERDELVYGAIEVFREYRSTHPRPASGDSEVRQSIERALSMRSNGEMGS